MEENLPIGLRFSILQRSFRKQLDEQLRERDLTGVQFGMLTQLSHLEASCAEEINQKDIENVAHLTHPTVTEILKLLEKKGFILCSPGKSDRRCKCISVTPKTAELIAEVAQVDESVFNNLCRGLSEEQIAAFTSAMDVMLANALHCCGKGKEL